MIDVVGDFVVCKLKTLQRVEINVCLYERRDVIKPNMEITVARNRYCFWSVMCYSREEVTPSEMLTCWQSIQPYLCLYKPCDSNWVPLY
jgi:hypothetical protein